VVIPLFEFEFRNSITSLISKISELSTKLFLILFSIVSFLSKIINSFIKEDLITDIKITIIPQIIGGKYTWIPPKETNEIFNLKRLWEIKSIKNLMNNEIHIHYKKI